MRVLRNNSGVSLIFVLASMLLLMAIGISAITAAGLSHGASYMKRDRNQLDLFAGSMERTIKAALEADISGAPVSNSRSLGGAILCAAHKSGPGRHTLSYTINPSLPGDWGAAYTVDITAVMSVEVFYPVTDTQRAAAAQTANQGGGSNAPGYGKLTGRTPKTAMINGDVTVTQTTVYQPGAAGDKPLTKITKTTYRYTGGYIEELDGYGVINTADDDSNMIISNPGVWTVTKHE